ncbi:hypothetical protein ROA7450_04006 [Roseovarius albus]|uniref:SRPBCC domain-containing protein n=1 Tax=Roseovarius albus TaxID=1247867 RepID=A0A1X7A775_9RHOB|nr:hypothetical protein [Roseovarius albus]SLN72209.1 hypothetical protein ROA7450_04006 [Roseovarius albus]
MAKITHQVGIAGEIKEIYRAMHEPEGLNGWWATTTDGTPTIGEVLDLHFADVVTLSFRIDELNENAKVGLHCVSGPGPWQNSTLLFSFKSDHDQVWVTLEHENPAATDTEFLYFSTKWTCYLLSLRDLIETGVGCPYPNDIKIHVGD